jgi:hypothetical protein
MFIRVIVFVNIELRNIVYGCCSRPPPPAARPSSRPIKARLGHPAENRRLEVG